MLKPVARLHPCAKFAIIESIVVDRKSSRMGACLLITSRACIQPKAKRRRKSRSAPKSKDSTKDELAVEDQEMVMVGTERRNAILNVLKHATSESWKRMVMHLSWCQNQRQSAISDAILSWPHLWPRSKTPVGSFPTEQQELASASASKLHLFVQLMIIQFCLFRS